MKGFSFLVDVNLPKYFSFFDSDQFEFVTDINDSMTDASIWNYALDNNLVIVTKDADFYHRCLLTEISPKIIHFQFGNYSLRQMHVYFQKNWGTIVSKLSDAKMIIASENSLEIVY